LKEGGGRPALRARYCVKATQPMAAKTRRRKRRKKKRPQL
jgi:hypothetical protein